MHAIPARHTVSVPTKSHIGTCAVDNIHYALKALVIIGGIGWRGKVEGWGEGWVDGRG